MCAYNVDEIDTFNEFHQHFTSSFCADILVPKNYKEKLYLEKSLKKHFRAKKFQVKY